jgi:hypothetical protein
MRAHIARVTCKSTATDDDSRRLKRTESVTGTCHPVDQKLDTSKSRNSFNQIDYVLWSN